MLDPQSGHLAQPGGVVDMGQAIRLDRPRLAKLLKAFRIKQNKTRASIDKNLRTERLSVELRTLDDDRTLARGVAYLESGRGPDDICVSVATLQIIANAYDIPRLMLDTCVSKPSNSPCVVERFSDFVKIQGTPGTRFHGHWATYGVPQHILVDTDEVAIVYLELAAGGYSDDHAHPGSELLLVLDGTLEVRLNDSGLRNRLESGDYIHFYSEESHSAWNIGASVAKVFLIRFYQFISGQRSSRNELAEELTTLLRALGTKDTKKRSAHLIARVVESLGSGSEPFDMSVDRRVGHEVVDRFGLARLLRLICSSNFQGGSKALSLAQLANRAKEHGLKGFSRSRIDRMQNGFAQVRRQELRELARLYQVEPFLFYNFLYPTVGHAVVIRAGNGTDGKIGDFKALPPELIKDPRVNVKVPVRRLADSDLALVNVELDIDGITPINRHPGHELVVPLEGEIEIRFGEMRRIIAPARGGYAHYSSRFDHCLANAGRSKAKFLVVRFHE